MTACQKCGGSGKIKAYLHISNGICFTCGGTGKGGKLAGPTVKHVPDDWYDGESASTNMSEIQDWIDEEYELARTVTFDEENEIYV